MPDLDPQPFDGDRCKHTQTHKLAESENHICLNCEQELLPPQEVPASDGEGEAI